MVAPNPAGDRPYDRAAYYARDGFSLQINLLAGVGEVARLAGCKVGGSRRL